MTTIDHNLQELLPHTATHAVQVVWSSTVAAKNNSPEARLSKVEFVLQIEALGADRGMIEAWIQTRDNRAHVLHATPVRIVLLVEKQGVHIDVLRYGTGAPERIAAVSLLHEQGSRLNGRPVVFAQTSLLVAAGFPPGSYEPPVASWLS